MVASEFWSGWKEFLTIVVCVVEHMQCPHQAMIKKSELWTADCVCACCVCRSTDWSLLVTAWELALLQCWPFFYEAPSPACSVTHSRHQGDSWGKKRSLVNSWFKLQASSFEPSNFLHNVDILCWLRPLSAVSLFQKFLVSTFSILNAIKWSIKYNTPGASRRQRFVPWMLRFILNRSGLSFANMLLYVKHVCVKFNFEVVLVMQCCRNRNIS